MEKIKKALGLFLSVMLLITFAVSIYFLSSNSAVSYEIFRESVYYPSALNVTRAIEVGESSPSQDNGGESTGFYNLLFLPSGMSSFNSAPVFSLLFLLIPPAFRLPGRKGIPGLCALKARWRHYMRQILGFLSPLEKCILSFEDRYDTAPFAGVSADLKPVSCLKQNTGFFYMQGGAL